MVWVELVCSIGAAICVPVYVVWNLLHPKSKEIRRLRGVVDEAHCDVHELQGVAAESSEWEGQQFQGWLQVHQLATKALKQYGPLDAYRGQAAPGRDELLGIQGIAEQALGAGGPITKKNTEEALQAFIAREPKE